MDRGSKRKDTKINNADHHQSKKIRSCQNMEETDRNINSTNEGGFWDSMPVNVMINIFQELPAKDLAQCALVCCYWQHILQDDYVWKQLFSLHWNIDPTVGLREDIKESSWLSEYKRLHLLQNSPATITSSVHHGENVLDLTFSRSGRYLCSSSKHIVVMWSIGDTIEIFNKFYISCEKDAGLDSISDMGSGIRYTVFNETDEFLLVFGLKLQIATSDGSDRMYQVLVYTFPDCYLIRTIDWWYNFGDANPCWFSRYTFIMTESNEHGFEGKLMLWSVCEPYQSKQLVNVDYDIDNVAVMNDGDGLQKLLFFSYIDEQTHADLEYSLSSHKISCFVVSSDLAVQPHVCNREHFCCVESKYWSRDPSHYMGDRYPSIDKHLGAAIRQIDDSLAEKFGVICRPVKEKSEDCDGKYSGKKLDLRIFDLKMNLLKVVPLQSMVPPQLFLLDHDYWFEENLNSLLISGDLDPGLLHYYDIHYDVHVKKKTGHTEGLNCAAFSPNSPFLLCTVSDDNLVKFWDFRKHSEI